MTYAEGPESNRVPVPVLVEHDGRSVALSADGRRAGSEREIPINHRRRTGPSRKAREHAVTQSVSPSLIHALISPARQRDIPDIPPIGEFK